jgi:hypothetical protein
MPATRGRWDAARVERFGDAIQARYAGRLNVFHDWGKLGSSLVSARPDDFDAGTLSHRVETVSAPRHVSPPSCRHPRQHSPHLRVIPTTGPPRGRDATLVERSGDATETRYARRSQLGDDRS